jgi:hypothetical protein
MDSLEFPLKFDTTGIAKLTDGTYDYYKQMLTISLLTEPGENPITPDFGVLDPSFMPVEPADFILNAAKYVPEVEITSIVPSKEPVSGSLSVEFSFKIVGDR